MDDYTKSLLLNELENLTMVMDVPPFRRKDYQWLMRNVEINNQDHKNTKNVLKICSLLMKG